MIINTPKVVFAPAKYSFEYVCQNEGIYKPNYCKNPDLNATSPIFIISIKNGEGKGNVLFMDHAKLEPVERTVWEAATFTKVTDKALFIEIK